ncbi:TPA: hypothetical protein IGZ61_002245 [Escherichia coli]|nr:hypothetical protein [Escherichia coli]
MSGTEKKTANKQASKGRSGKTSAQKVAAITETDNLALGLPETLPGHYVPVGSAPKLNELQTTTQEKPSPVYELPPLGWSAADVAAATDERPGPVCASVEQIQVLEVRAIPAGGFWRCGLFWSATPWTVVINDDSDDEGLITPEGALFVTSAVAARLKAEPMLIVTELETVTEPA